MNESLDKSFGVLIAFILPGFIGLAGVSRFSSTVSGWMSVAPSPDPTVGGFLYVLLGSLAAGLVISGFRWLLIDALLHATGLKQPELDFSKVQDKFEAFQLAVEHNYRYYQFYANSVLAAAFYGVCDQWMSGRWPLGGLVLGLILEAGLLLMARDCLRRYYRRTSQLLGSHEDDTTNVSYGL